VETVDPPPEKDFEDVVVRIGWDGNAPNWSINEQPFPTLAAVATQLQTIATIQTAAPVILHPQPIVPLGTVIETYDAAKVAGFAKVAFAVNPQER
jgi:biopolymer transport protein ExbD